MRSAPRREHQRRRCEPPRWGAGVVVGFTIALAGCVVGGEGGTVTGPDSVPDDAHEPEVNPDDELGPPGEAPDSEAAEQGSTRPTGCPPTGRVGAPEGASAPVTLLTERDDGLRVEAVVYPRPDHEGQPWSQWGQGLVLDDGRFWSAIGDHRGADGNSYFFSYDPDTSTLTRFGDVLSVVDHQDGAWGYGKVHGQLVAGPCGEVWAATYWGSRRGLEFGDGYEGDLLLRLDPASYTIEPVTVPVPRHGIPSLAGWPQGGLLYGEAVEPESDTGRFFVFDVLTGDVVLDEAADGHTGYRNVLVDAAGVAHVAVGGGQLAAYRPGSDGLERADVSLPGDWLRASTHPAADGTVYGVTRDPDQLFAVEPDGNVRDLGPARGYVASMALHPDGERFLYVPGAHGDGWQQGTPLVVVDGDTGEDDVLVELHELGVEAFGLRLGGTYAVAVDSDRDLVYIGMNAGDAGEASFGEVVLVVVHLP